MIYCNKCGKISPNVVHHNPTYKEWLEQKEEWEDDLDYYKYKIIWNPVCPQCGVKARYNTRTLHKCFECGKWCKDGAIGCNGLWFCETCHNNNAPRKYIGGSAWEKMHKLRCDFVKMGYKEDAAEILAYTLLQGNVDEVLEMKQYPNEWPYNMTYNEYGCYKASLGMLYTEEEAEKHVRKMYRGEEL